MSASDEFSQMVARILIAPGFGWIDDFIDSGQAKKLRALADHRFSAGEFHAAGIGQGEVNLEIRSDQIHWVERDAPEPLESIVDRYRAFLPVINSTCFLGLKSVESMLAVYPAGAFYSRHRDRFRRDAHRVVSLVLYLNERWNPGDGGELVLYPESGADAETLRRVDVTDDAGLAVARSECLVSSDAIVIEPRAGRLVVFLSELEHEVRVTKVPRYSLTSWLLDRPD